MKIYWAAGLEAQIPPEPRQSVEEPIRPWLVGEASQVWKNLHPRKLIAGCGISELPLRGSASSGLWELSEKH